MTPRTLLASASRLARVRDLRARDRADVHALAERLVQLEARGTLPVRAQLAGRAAGGVVDAVARVGAHVDALQDDVVGLAAVRAGGADGEGRGREGLGCFGAEECCLGDIMLAGMMGGNLVVEMRLLVTGADCFCPMLIPRPFVAKRLVFVFRLVCE